MNLTPLTTDDIEAAHRLSTLADWNQTPTDWRRLLALAPDGCFGGWVEDTLVATGTLVRYEDTIGWIGMILVDPEHRRNGYATRIFEHLNDIGNRDGLVLGLDATDAGRAVYRRSGYVDTVAIERWRGFLNRPAAPRSLPFDSTAAGTVTPYSIQTEDEISTLATFDRRTVGVDRTPLLERFHTESNVRVIAIVDDDTDLGGGEAGFHQGTIRGYGVLRSGREAAQFGPVVASNGAVMNELLAGVSPYFDDTPMIVDVFPTAKVTALLRRWGLQQHRSLMRMTDGEETPLLTGSSVRAAAGFELG